MSLIDSLLTRVCAERGQTFVEYALILASLVVGVLLILTWTGLGAAVQAAVDAVTAAF